MFRNPPTWLSRTGTAVSQVRVSLSGAPVVLSFFGFIAALGIAVTSPFPCLADPENATAILGTLLAAQAAITALGLAVTLFMLQGISSRSDVDDRMYREYVRRSWVRGFFWGNIAAVVVTGALLVFEGFATGVGTSTDVAWEPRNFVVAAATAFSLNMMLAGALFEIAIRQSRPERWKALRRDITKADVGEAVRDFVYRTRAASQAQSIDEIDASAPFPDRGEGSADEAVRALLDDARRAMAERRHEEFSRSLNFLRELVDYAMDEIKRSGIRWGAPGAPPAWPPLSELSRYLYSFREDVIRRGDREYIFELLRFDYWLTSEGLRARCGELFGVGLNGYRWNYQIAIRVGAVEYQGILRDRFVETANILGFRTEPTVEFPYTRQIVRQQERLLSDAMHTDQPRDFVQLHRGFRAWLDGIRMRWSIKDSTSSRAFELYEQLEQLYRIALMGLGGRALLRAQLDKVADISPFLNVTRETYSDLGQLTQDLVDALSWSHDHRLFLWQDWESEGALPNRAFFISPEQYPLTLFTLRLIELSSDTMATVELQGRARQVLDWFRNHAQSIEGYVRADPALTLQQRRELAELALRAAVRSAEIAEDYAIIGRDISTDRVSTLRAEVCTAAFSGNSVERLFERAGAHVSLSANAADAPSERAICRLVHKGFFADTADGAVSEYIPLDGDEFAHALSHDVLQRFCEALDGATQLVISLDTPDELLRGIDRAIDDLASSEHLVVVLAGNWSHLQVGLRLENLDGYEPSWRLPKDDQVGEIGRFRGYPILSAEGHQGRCAYVVDLATWGHFLRARIHGDHKLRVEITPISVDRAMELLADNPNHFASEPDEASKLRKLQTLVEVVIGARTGFHVADPTRARRISPIGQVEESDDVAQG